MHILIFLDINRIFIHIEFYRLLFKVRLIVVPKLEMWIMNPKVSRAAQELLMAVAMNCTTHTNDEVEAITNNEVITNFLKLRFKNKPNINLYLACIKELANANREVNLPTLIKLTIFNELSNARNPNNMQMLNVLFGCNQQIPSSGTPSQISSSNDLAAISLAAVFVDLLLQKECYLRALRALLREIVRALRYDSSLNLHTFCYHLMNLDPKVENQVSMIFKLSIFGYDSIIVKKNHKLMVFCLYYRYENSNLEKDFFPQWLMLSHFLCFYVFPQVYEIR